MADVLAFVMLVALIVYALSGGADFGGGMWDLLAGGTRARGQRDAIEHAIAPIWEANHVWLIVVIVLLFAGFPAAFSAITTALHIPLTVILVGIVLRGSAFVFRKYDSQHDEVHRRWSMVFGAASLATPFFMGCTLGAIASGEIRVAGLVVQTGFLAGWLTPFALACGLFAQALFGFLAAAYLAADCGGDRELEEDFRLRALVSGVALAPVAWGVFILARTGAPQIFLGLTDRWAPWLLAATSIAAIGALWLLLRRRYRAARLAAMAQAALILTGWGLAQYPFLLVPDVTIEAGASSPAMIRIMLIVLAAGSLVLVPSFVWLFRVFKSAPRSPG